MNTWYVRHYRLLIYLITMINVNHKDFFNLLSVVNMDLLGIVTKASEVKKKHKIKRNI